MIKVRVHPEVVECPKCGHFNSMEHIKSLEDMLKMTGKQTCFNKDCLEVFEVTVNVSFDGRFIYDEELNCGYRKDK